ncbi:MAG: hypothetical protein ACR2LN_03005 [Candidatus Levyibacteriota bacterium]
MKAEKVILSFVAVFIGLIAAGVAFYLYQSTKAIPPDQTKPAVVKSAVTAAPTPSDTDILTVDEPKDETVINKPTITIKGKSVKGAVVTVSTQDSDQVVQPADNGDFTLTQTIPSGTSILHFSAIFPDGTQKQLQRTITYSTENF